MKAPVDPLIRHVMATLPDSFTARKALINSLLAAVPLKHPLRADVARTFHYLQEHEILQSQLSLNFAPEPKK